MKLNTMHYVLTVEDSITMGQHLYLSASSLGTAFGIVNTFVMNYAVTNTLHNELYTMLQQIMAMWHLNYNEDPFFNGHSNPHVPDITTTAGPMDMMAIGNLLELANVIDRHSYQQGIHWTEEPEMALAQWRYRKLQVYFTKRYVTMVGGKSVSPLSVFRRSLVEFAAAIIVYKRSVKGAAYPKVKGCTKYQLEQKMINLFKSNYPELLPALRALVAKEHEFMYWTGPPITIRPVEKGDHTRRTKWVETMKAVRQLDFDDNPIFLPAAQIVDEAKGNFAPQDDDGDVEMADDRHDMPKSEASQLPLRRSLRRSRGK